MALLLVQACFGPDRSDSAELAGRDPTDRSGLDASEGTANDAAQATPDGGGATDGDAGIDRAASSDAAPDVSGGDGSTDGGVPNHDAAHAGTASLDGSTDATSELGPDAGDCSGERCRPDCSAANVLFVIDGSGSMCAAFADSTRWQALRSALLDPQDGVIYRFQRMTAFGLLIYDGTIDPFLAILSTGTNSPACAGEYVSMKSSGPCPALYEVPVARDNATAISVAFPTRELGGSTPTDRALGRAVDQLIAAGAGAGQDGRARRIVLVTDGLPDDICAGGAGGDGVAQQQAVIAAVDRAAQAGIETFVVNLDPSSPAVQAHLAQVAIHGRPTEPAAQAFTPQTTEALAQTLAAIAHGDCDP